MRKTVSPDQQRAAIIARAIKGVRGEHWRALPAGERREAIQAARRVMRALDRLDAPADDAGDEDEQ
jgi:hypothetical protein